MKANTVSRDQPFTVRAIISTGTRARRARRTAPSPARVMVLERGDRAPIAQLQRVLGERGLEPVVVRAEDQPELPPPASLQMAVLVGTNRYGAEADRASHAAERDWLRRADRAGTPILGIGHGARALAAALGGGIEPVERGQRGWALVDTSVPHVIGGGPWLAWQHEIIRLPPGAELLAHNRLGPQAFRLGRHVGVQFHPEATAGSAAAWSAREAETLDYLDTLTATNRDPRAAQACARRLFAAFVDEL